MQAGARDQPVAGFTVHLEGFDGPFDLLLALIGRHQLEVTVLSLSTVTDDFIAHIRSLGDTWDLGLATEFLVVAATLLDLKAARLLPRGEVEDEDDLALLEARDLLFARLLQYRAFRQAAGVLETLVGEQSLRFGRAVPLDPELAAAQPEVVLGVTPVQLAALVAKAEAGRPPPPTVAVDHVHAVAVSVPEQAEVLRERLALSGQASFRALVADCDSVLLVVARFLALLELYREGAVGFDQVESLAELRVRWLPGGTTDQPGRAANQPAPADQPDPVPA